MALILASGSPRRRELMGLITDSFTVKVSDAEENTDFSQTPDRIVISLAEQKGRAVMPLCSENGKNRRRCPSRAVLSAKIILSFARSFKSNYTENADGARAMLRHLSGRTHTVYTGVSIHAPNGTVSFSDKTDVTFNELSDCDIESYIATGEPFDKAGAYGIQGKGALLVKGICGDFYNVMGFPVARVYRELKRLCVL